MAQFAGWVLITSLYFRDNVEGALREGLGPLHLFAFATTCGMAMACSSVLGAVYLRMPSRWLRGIQTIPTSLGLSLLAALPWTTAMTLLVRLTDLSEWRQYSVWMFFHASVLMVAWSGVFLGFVRSGRIPRTQAQTLGAEAVVVNARSSHSERAEASSRDATPSSSPKSVAVRWAPGDRVGLQERKRVRFSLVRDIACIRAAGEYTEVHLSSGQVAFVTQGLRHWESQLPESFVRIHRSTLVNLELTEELVHIDGAWRVRVRGCPEPLTVSRRLEPAVRAKAFGQKARLAT